MTSELITPVSDILPAHANRSKAANGRDESFVYSSSTKYPTVLPMTLEKSNTLRTAPLFTPLIVIVMLICVVVPIRTFIVASVSVDFGPRVAIWIPNG